MALEGVTTSATPAASAPSNTSVSGGGDAAASPAPTTVAGQTFGQLLAQQAAAPAAALPESVAAELTISGEASTADEDQDLDVDDELAADSLLSFFFQPLVAPAPGGAPASGDGADAISAVGISGGSFATGGDSLDDMLTVELDAADILLSDTLLNSSDTERGNALSPAQHTAAAQQTSGEADVPAPAQLRNTVGTEAWADELGHQLTVMAKKGLDSASLRLSPEHLGPLEVRIAVKDNEASVWFGASNADTRTALEQSMPRLRELLSTQGMSLTDAGVFREPPRGNAQQPQAGFASSSGEAAAGGETTTSNVVSIRKGLVDTYA